MGRSNATSPFVLLVRQILKIWFVYTFEAVSDFTKIVGILKKKRPMVDVSDSETRKYRVHVSECGT